MTRARGANPIVSVPTWHCGMDDALSAKITESFDIGPVQRSRGCRILEKSAGSRSNCQAMCSSARSSQLRSLSENHCAWLFVSVISLLCRWNVEEAFPRTRCHRADAGRCQRA